LSIFLGSAHVGGRAVAEAGVRALVVALDVSCKRGACVIERLELAAPDEPLLQLPEPGFDERL